ncbi:MAG: hypothetical protein DRQ55_09085 [Planctomycetota bacterium]|nr:MAG: hypothetical protein DRQ55_09085 [Planctomycetota bacterium]
MKHARCVCAAELTSASRPWARGAWPRLALRARLLRRMESGRAWRRLSRRLSAALLSAACVLLSGPALAAQASPLAGGQRDITPRSIEAVERALTWLAENQSPDGSWTAHVGYKLNQNYEISADSRPHVGVTALAGLAFLAAGHLPNRGKFGAVISRAADWTLARVNEVGYITAHGSRMYSHAFATLFLAEVYGMTDRHDVRGRLQKAVDHIVGSQNEYGSWRYEPLAAESDMSITVCQLNALRAARNVGIRVPRSTIDRAKTYIAASYVGAGERMAMYPDNYYSLSRGAFKYQATANTRSSFALTSAGLAALHNAGVDGLSMQWTLDDGRVQDIDLQWSIMFLRDSIERISPGSYYYQHYFYWYGHYYASQALYVIGGEHWAWYYPIIREQLVSSQQADGSWRCRVGPGEHFSTAVGAMILSLPYGYLPIFQR